MQMQKFICQQCGECCSHIRGRIAAEEKEFLREYAFGKMPLVQLVPLEQTSFPLWDWEAKRFKEWQKKVDIDGKIMPSRAVFDLNENRAIIVTYFMDSDRCPFLLKDNKCAVYNHKRAYICRLFPFQRSPFLEIGEKSSPENLLGSCPSIKDILPKMPRDDFKAMIRAFYESFGESFLNAVQNDIVTAWVNKTIVDLCKKHKIVRPAINYPYELLLKRVENSKKTDLTEYLVEKNIYSKEEMEKLIKRFDDNIDAKEKLNECLE